MRTNKHDDLVTVADFAANYMSGWRAGISANVCHDADGETEAWKYGFSEGQNDRMTAQGRAVDLALREVDE